MTQPISGSDDAAQAPKVEQGNSVMNQQNKTGEGLRAQASATTSLQNTMNEITEALK